MAVSDSVRYEVIDRAKHKSELTGAMGRPLQCCHLDHTRNQYYNGEDAVVLVTDIEHLAYHLLFSGRSVEIGLHKGHNQWAVDTLWKDILKFNERTGKKIDNETLLADIERAKNFWFYYLGIEP